MIRSSSARQVEQLVAALESGAAVEREAAVARLIVIGERAVVRILPLLENQHKPETAIAALAALEAIGAPRALEPILAATDRDEVATAAIQAARAYLGGPHGLPAVDRLTAIALQAGRPEKIRLAALQALAGVGRKTLRPVLKKLETDESASIRAAAAALKRLRHNRGGVAGPRHEGPNAADALDEAAEGELPEDANVLQAALAAAGDAAPLVTLLRILERVREREGTVPAGSRALWTIVRGAAHASLANRGSRLALYDLRESLESAAEPLPVDFVAALSRIGDPSCLEPIAAAHSRSSASRNDWWRRHLADAFHEIARRHGVTRRHAVMKKIEKRYGTDLTRPT